ncbi:MAG: PEP-CTERM sorting domain-containing protein [Myxococcales bacterium]|nr:MAG: PEP-CTERM sorting domain-containing protein [Myxococcales bacterium]
MKFLYAPTSLFYQYIFYFDPLFFKAYGSFRCQKAGITCTDNFETDLGSITSSGMVTRFLLNTTTTMTTMGATNKFHPSKVTTGGTAMDFVVSKNYYLHLLAPWTTGKASVYNPLSTYFIKPALTGYDKNLAGADLTVTRTSTTAKYKAGTMGKVYYSYMQTKQYLKDVSRVVSLVRPRLTHTYQRPRILSDPIISNFSAARNWTMKVFFLPEPGALLMLGAGIAGLAGLSFLRRR